jgi:hypothetical protein
MPTRKIFVVFVFLGIICFACKDSSVTSNLQNNYFSVPAWDYSDNHFFVDTVYKTSFLYVMNDSTGVLPQGVFDKRIKSDLPSFSVWVQCDNTYPDKRVVFSWISLPERPINGYDSIPYRNHGSAYDTCFYGTFRELYTSEFYIDPMAGFIGLKINVPENYNIGVTYETYEGKKYGEGKFDVNGNQSLILKMIKCANQSPDATPRAWELKMKNIYRLPFKDISEQNFKLGVKFRLNQIYSDTIPGMGMPLNQILLIDRYTGSTRRWNPDGKFDWIDSRTIYPETGDIIFPTLYPFRDELRKAGVDSNLIFWEIYSQRKTLAQQSITGSLYFIKGYTDTLK